MDEQTFVGDRVRIARELAGVSQAELSRRIGVSAAAVSQFESDSLRPSSGTMQTLSEQLEVPVRFFSLPFVDTHEGFFRSLRKTAVAARRRARAVAHVAHDVALHAQPKTLMPAGSIPGHAVSLDAPVANIEMAAADVRSGWNIPSGPIENVVELLESRGVLVIRMPFITAAVDAFSLPFTDHPVVVLGADKNDRARSRFDAAHELGHLVIHGDQVWGMKKVEDQAHAFAAAFLMPARDIRHELPSVADWGHLFELKMQWQVSLAALLRRARDLDVMSPQTYLSAIKFASARGWRRTEPVPLGEPERPRMFHEIVSASPGQQLREFLPPAVLDEISSSIA